MKDINRDKLIASLNKLLENHFADDVDMIVEELIARMPTNLLKEYYDDMMDALDIAREEGEEE